MPFLLSVVSLSWLLHVSVFFFFFFNDTATTEIYTLSLHDALPISAGGARARAAGASADRAEPARVSASTSSRSEEHTSELQSRPHLVCRLLLEKKKTTRIDTQVQLSSPHGIARRLRRDYRDYWYVT